MKGVSCERVSCARCGMPPNNAIVDAGKYLALYCEEHWRDAWNEYYSLRSERTGDQRAVYDLQAGWGEHEKAFYARWREAAFPLTPEQSNELDRYMGHSVGTETAVRGDATTE